tara:strand:+ start:12604 stop:14385 length:1782 start_codon:yes stop_codon:yes gene_type:complete
MGRRLNNSTGGLPASRKITGAITETFIQAGQVVQLTGSGPYTVVLPNPAPYAGVNTYYWNNSGGDVTLTTPSGVFNGPSGKGTNATIIEDGFTLAVASDGTNYFTQWENMPDKTGSSGAVLTSSGVDGGLYWGSTALTGADTLGTFNKNSTLSIDLIAEGIVSTTLPDPVTFTAFEALPLSLSISSAGVVSGSLSAATLPSYTLKIEAAQGSVIKRFNFELGVSLTNAVPTWSTASNLGTSTFGAGSAISKTVTATVGTGSITYTLSSGQYPAGTSLNAGNGVISGTSSDSVGSYTYNFTVGATANGFTVYRAFTWSLVVNPPIGQAIYTGVTNTAGDQSYYTWVAPAGVSTVSVAAIGAGGGGYYGWAVCGGAGGALTWANGIPVTPGSSYTIAVGRGGCWSQSGGGCSCFPNIMAANGGRCGCCPGCCYINTGAITGNAGGASGTPAYPDTAGGGGGGGGYAGNQCRYSNSGYTGCHGGGGNANSHHSSTYGTGGGGGTGIYGQGNNGTCGNGGYSHSTGGGGGQGSNGTCGKPGEPWNNGQGNGWSCGGCFGGGGGGGGTSHGGGWGGPGAVRIIWGNGRAYPSTNTADQ